MGETLGRNRGKPYAGASCSLHHRASFWRPMALVAAAITMAFGAAGARGQSTNAKDLGAGKLLVSSRGLSDPSFVKSVVLLVQYDSQGTVGLMINRRTKAPLSSIVQDLNIAKHGSDPIYIGGPVELNTVLGLTRSAKKPDGATSVLSDVYLVSSKELLEKTLAASSGPEEVRLYVGYCGWAPGQLENEMRLGGWWIFNGSAALVFDPNPDSVWPRLIARTEEQIATNLAAARLP